MKRIFDPLVLAGLAAEQWGLVTTRQAGRLGVSAQQLARMAAAGVLERLRHGVYRLAGSPPDGRDGVRAAWLMLDPAVSAALRVGQDQPGVVSHRSAAVLHHLGDLDADATEFTVPSRKQSRSADVRFHVEHLDRQEWTLVDGLPVTTILVTIGQLAAADLDSGHLAGVVRDALTTYHLSVDDVMTALRPYAHRYGVPLGAAEQLVDRLLEESGIPETTRRIGVRVDNSQVLATLAAKIPTLDRAAKAAASAIAAAIPALDPSVWEGLHNRVLLGALRDTVAKLETVMTPATTSTIATPIRESTEKTLTAISPEVLAALAAMLQQLEGDHRRANSQTSVG